MACGTEDQILNILCLEAARTRTVINCGLILNWLANSQSTKFSQNYSLAKVVVSVSTPGSVPRLQ